MALIVIEGGDGAGKTTQVELLTTLLKKSYNVSSLHFPQYDNGIIGEVISKFLNGYYGKELHPEIISLLYALDRKAYQSQLKELSSKDSILILDRYVYSNIAYQSARLNASKQDKEAFAGWIKSIEFGEFKLPPPTINIYLDVPLQASRNNLKKANDKSYLQNNESLDINEKDETLQNSVREYFTSIFLTEPNCFKIDCFDKEKGQIHSIDFIHNKIVELLFNNNIIKL